MVRYSPRSAAEPSQMIAASRAESFRNFRRDVFTGRPSRLALGDGTGSKAEVSGGDSETYARPVGRLTRRRG